MKMNFGIKLKELREEQNLTQENLANIININRVQYNQYENDYNTIPLKHLNSLCNYFNVSIDYIFGFTNIKKYKNISQDIERSKVSLRIKEFRKEKNLTQIKLANLLNIANGTIAEYERGTNLIATPFLYTICKKYKISADYLLGKVDEPKYLS